MQGKYCLFMMSHDKSKGIISLFVLTPPTTKVDRILIIYNCTVWKHQLDVVVHRVFAIIPFNSLFDFIGLQTWPLPLFVFSFTTPRKYLFPLVQFKCHTFHFFLTLTFAQKYTIRFLVWTRTFKLWAIAKRNGCLWFPLLVSSSREMKLEKLSCSSVARVTPSTHMGSSTYHTSSAGNKVSFCLQIHTNN